MAACAALACKHDRSLGVPHKKRSALLMLRIFVPAFFPYPSVCAEERRARRIRTGDCLSEASASPAPAGASTAGCPPQRQRRRDADSRVAFLLLTFLWRDKKSELPPGNPRPTGISEPGSLKEETASTGSARTVVAIEHGSRIKSGMTSLRRGQDVLMAATSLSAQASACPASRASTITRTRGSVPLARISTRPLLPSSVFTASVSEASNLLPAQS